LGPKIFATDWAMPSDVSKLVKKGNTILAFWKTPQSPSSNRHGNPSDFKSRRPKKNLNCCTKRLKISLLFLLKGIRVTTGI